MRKSSYYSSPRLLALLLVCLASTAAADSAPFRIIQQPRSQVAVRGARVSFRCDYELISVSASDVNIKWLFDDSSSSSVRLRQLTDIEQFEFDTSALHILAYDPTIHTGIYRCLLNSSQTALLSLPANLSLARKSSNLTHSPT